MESWGFSVLGLDPCNWGNYGESEEIDYDDDDDDEDEQDERERGCFLWFPGFCCIELYF